MTAIGSLVFCNDCGNLLEARTSAKRKRLNCDVCSTTSKDTSDKVIITRSKPSDFPSVIRTQKSEFQVVNEDDVRQDAEIDEICEKCNNDKAKYHSQQRRGADEGSTIFYTCTKCGHKWTTDN